MTKLKREHRVIEGLAKERAVRFLGSYRAPSAASWVADAIWPSHTMTAQGAGGAASRVLKVLEKEGRVRWTSGNHGRGWVLA